MPEKALRVLQKALRVLARAPWLRRQKRQGR